MQAHHTPKVGTALLAYVYGWPESYLQFVYD
jgi:hypothetical protein